MAILLSAKEITKAFDSRPLFADLHFSIESAERVGLIGPNGAGKSTLLKILAGQITADHGEVVSQRGLRVSHLEQVPFLDSNKTVREILLEQSGNLDEWTAAEKGDELIWKLKLDAGGLEPDTLVKNLSGGWKKRLAFARALMSDPDVLLMDEPTNHLDVEGILWLEELISDAPFATLTITHDRFFLERVANRILELDRRNPGGILSIKGPYSRYLEVKESMMTAQENRENILRGNLRRETEWVKAGAKARTTKQQARIQRHSELESEVKELASRNIKKLVSIDFESIENSPKRLVDAKKISKSYSKDRPLFSNLDLLLTPGTRVGVLGANGSGKSTLIRVLLQLEKQDSGTISHSDRLQVAYFEQNRDQLDPDVSLLRSVCPHGDQVIYRGRPLHIRSYLEKFLFSYDTMDMNIGSLSGGEQSRVLLAKLMLTEANVLVLDEPTNDLDIPTLHVLEEALTQFEGAILLVTHDRFFLDRVATQILAFPVLEKEKKAGTLHTFADLAQWESWHANQINHKENKKSESSAPTVQKQEASKPKPSSKKVEALTKKIERAELAYAKLEAECSTAEVMSNIAELSKRGREMQELQAQIDALYREWESTDQ